jgi:integrase
MNDYKAIVEQAEKLSMSDMRKFLLEMVDTIDKKDIQLKESDTLYSFKLTYLQYIRSNFSPKYYKSVFDSFNHLLEYFTESKHLLEITNYDIENFKMYLMQKAPKGYTVYFRTLKASFNKAVKWGKIATNPFNDIKIPKTQQKDLIYVTREEIDLLLPHIQNTSIRNIIVISFNTGMRLQEVVKLRWRNIQMKEKVIVLGDKDFSTKSRQQRTIPFSKETERILASLKTASPDSFVFSKDSGYHYSDHYVSKTFKKACRKANLNEEITFHKLRHGFATRHATELSTPPATLMKLMGHANLSTTMRYVHVSQATLTASMRDF